MTSQQLNRLECTLRREQAIYRHRQWLLLVRMLAAPIQLRAAELRKEAR